MKKNLVLGTATGYGIEQIQNFVKSFRRYNQTAEIVFLVKSDRPQELDDFFKQYRVQPLTFETHVIADTGINNSRYLRYSEFFADADYDNCLLADVRDLVFQSDPFVNMPNEPYLWAFEEDRGIRINSCPHNSNWILETHGANALTAIGDNPIICSGTIMGSQDQIQKLIRLFITELLTIKESRPHAYRNVVIDQAIVNHIVYTQADQLALTIKSNGDVIGTIGQTVTQAQAVDIISKQQDHITVNGHIPPIIHQYDRSPDLTQFYDSLYAT